MEFKIYNSVPEEKVRLTIGTHCGAFSTKEIVSVSLLYILHHDFYDVCIIRTSNAYELQMCDIRLSSITSRNEETGITYSKVCDIWHDLGSLILHSINGNISTHSLWYDAAWNELNDEFSLLDSEESSSHHFSFISDFFPTWDMEQDFDKAFSEALSFTVCVLEKHMRQSLSKYFSKMWNQTIHDIEK